MRKIPRELDNPIENIFVDVSELITPLFRYFNFTPNKITIINIICSIICLYYLYIGEYKLGVLFYILTYLFDCTDGFFARKYKMETYFGDLLDHYTDYIFWLGLLYILIFRIHFYYNDFFLIVLFILICGSLIHIGCAEHYNKIDPNVNTQLSKLKYLCPKEYIHYTKYFGTGSLILFTIIFLLFFVKKE